MAPTPTTDVLTWNVAGRVRSVAQQAAALAQADAQTVALQEVRATAVTAWQDALGALGYSTCLTSLSAGVAAADANRRLGVLVASRLPVRAEAPLDLPWPERHLLVTLATADAPVLLCNVHSPISQKADLVKVRTLEALRAWAAATAPAPALLVGDLNTPQYESREGEVRSFARTRSGAIRPDYGVRHDEAELGIVPGLRDHGFVDAFRAVHGYGARDRSWMYPNRKLGYRLDHAFVRGRVPTRAAYLHTWREQRLSDHAALHVHLA